MNNKKGNADTYVVVSKWVYYIIVIFIVSLSIIFFVVKGVTFLDAKTSVVPTLSHDLIISRITNVCLAYEEEGRVFQNVLDVTKINVDTLSTCVMGSVFSLSVETYDSPINRFFATVGVGNLETTYSRYVLLKIDENIHPAILRVII